ncbi:IclR family transcriptional regulator [Pengzhenrongella sicca]|uniref:Glycerol operon regulatory protein n=1 Tax=Pengzhenrongella sicca TaxID=2819238 RepID=A0A8A4ZBV6_9MICO|nr:IclR family transcriptional regulator [Pengzhenrongella sicca]QTE28076.1 IclR family transcriptional regulator [Pengzhenrongella sicca]
MELTTTADSPPRDMVGKALLLLTVVGRHTDGASLSELARETGFPLSTTHRLLASLGRDGFVELDAVAKRYRLGLRLFQLGARVSASLGFGGVALPVLEHLSEVTTEASLLSVRDGHHQLYVHHVEARHQIGVKGDPGGLGPLHCTSIGKVLIAFADPVTREELISSISLVRFTDRTVTDRDRLRSEVALVRGKGFAITDQEHEEGIRAIAVPVFGSAGTVVAAVAIACPAFRVSLKGMGDFLPPLTAAAERLAALLPHR